MGTVISLINQKGGVGKTSSTMNIAMGLSMLNYKVLVIDADPQCDLTTAFGIFDTNYTVYDFLEGDDLPDLDEIKIADHLYIVSGHRDLGELKLSKRTFEQPVKMIKKDWDFVIIDCQPQRIIRSKLTLNECVLNCSDGILIPLDINYNSVKGTIDFIQSIDRIKTSYNPDLMVIGIFFTIVNPRETQYKEFRDHLDSQNSSLLLDTFIRRDVNVKKSQSVGLPLALYAEDSNALDDYSSLINEILKRI